MNHTNKGQPVPRLLGPRTRASATAAKVRAGQKLRSLDPHFTPPHPPPPPPPLVPKIKGTHRQRMCDDLRCHGAKLPAPDATKAKKVIKFERMEALPQTMH